MPLAPHHHHSLSLSLSPLSTISSLCSLNPPKQQQQRANSKGKPHPELFELAASKFDPPPLSPASVLVFEDAPIGVEAALAAGMRCVFVPDERTPRSDAHERACVVLKSLEDFDPPEWGLPAW